MFKIQYTDFVRIVFRNLTFNLYLKFLKEFLVFCLCRNFSLLFLTLKKSCSSAWDTMFRFGLISQIVWCISKLKNIFHQFFGCTIFNFEYLSHCFWCNVVEFSFWRISSKGTLKSCHTPLEAFSKILLIWNSVYGCEICIQLQGLF